jgi:hypothetical protein
MRHKAAVSRQGLRTVKDDTKVDKRKHGWLSDESPPASAIASLESRQRQLTDDGVPAHLGKAYSFGSIEVYTPFEADHENPSVRHPEGGAVLRAGAAPVVEAGGRHVGVPQPFLHFAQVGAPVQGVGGGRGPQGVRAKAFSVDSRRLGVFSQDAVVHGPVGERPVSEPPPRRVFQGPEQWAVRIFAVAGGAEVIVDALEGERVGWHVAHFAAFPQNAQVGHALAALEVAHAQAAEFLAAQPVVEEGRQDGAVALAFERVGRGHFQEHPGLAIAQHRGFALVAFGLGAFDPAHRVVGDRVDFAKVIK